jgi:hypothetical protein
MKIALIAVVSSLLAGCASAGLYNMSDEWCAAHLDASAARCPENEEARRVAANERERVVVAESEGASND